MNNKCFVPHIKLMLIIGVFVTRNGGFSLYGNEKKEIQAF